MTQITPPLNALLKSAQNIHIAVGYIINEMISGAVTLYEAAELNISVYGYGTLKPEAKVTAVLMNRWEQNGVKTFQQDWIKHLSLTDQEEDLVAFGIVFPLRDTAMARAINPGNLVTVGVPQIAVVVDDVWQQDPEQWPGAHNFNFAWKIPAGK